MSKLKVKGFICVNMNMQIEGNLGRVENDVILGLRKFEGQKLGCGNGTGLVGEYDAGGRWLEGVGYWENNILLRKKRNALGEAG